MFVAKSDTTFGDLPDCLQWLKHHYARIPRHGFTIKFVYTFRLKTLIYECREMPPIFSSARLLPRHDEIYFSSWKILFRQDELFWFVFKSRRD